MFNKWLVVLVCCVALPTFAEEGAEASSTAEEAREAIGDDVENAEGAEDTESGECTDEDGPLLLIDGEPNLRCVALFGDDEERAAHAKWRADRVQDIQTGKHAVTVTHRVSKYQSPRPTRVDGMRVVGMRRALVEDLPGVCDAHGESAGNSNEKGETDAAPKKRREWVAEVWLGPELANQCASELQILRVDDHIGTKISVLAITEKGMLLDHDGALAWVNAPDTQIPPAIRLVWRSDFRVVGPSPHQSASSSSSKPTRKTSKSKAAKRAAKKASKGKSRR
jgi:hypothetical protein